MRFSRQVQIPTGVCNRFIVVTCPQASVMYVDTVLYIRAFVCVRGCLRVLACMRAYVFDMVRIFSTHVLVCV